MCSLFWRVLRIVLSVYSCDIDKLIVFDKRSIVRELRRMSLSKVLKLWKGIGNIRR